MDNIPSDFLSRAPIKENSDDDEHASTTGKYLQDIDNFNYLSCLDVDQLVEDNQTSDRNPGKIRHRNFKLYRLDQTSGNDVNVANTVGDGSMTITPITR